MSLTEVWVTSVLKSPGLFSSILADFIYAEVWMVTPHPLISKSSSPFNNPLVTVPKAPITIGIIVNFMFYSFFNSLARSRYLSLISHSFNFTLWSAGIAKSTILQVLSFFFFFFFFLLLLIIMRSGLLDEIWWSVRISKCQRSLCVRISANTFSFPQLSYPLIFKE